MVPPSVTGTDDSHRRNRSNGSSRPAVSCTLRGVEDGMDALRTTREGILGHGASPAMIPSMVTRVSDCLRIPRKISTNVTLDPKQIHEPSRLLWFDVFQNWLGGDILRDRLLNFYLDFRACTVTLLAPSKKQQCSTMLVANASKVKYSDLTIN